MVVKRKYKAVILDRDGVINRSIVKKGKPYAPRKLKQFIFLPKVKKSINILKKKYKIFIVTNQPDINNKLLSKESLKQMNDKIKNILKISEIYTCPHIDSQNCKCRKPKIGLIKKIFKKNNIIINDSFMIGDRKKDIDCGLKAGLKTIFIDRNYREKKPENYHFKFNNLYQASIYINKF